MNRPRRHGVCAGSAFDTQKWPLDGLSIFIGVLTIAEFVAYGRNVRALCLTSSVTQGAFE